MDFSLHRGEIHALCGENGAGKSTLMNIIDGIHQPDEGAIVARRTEGGHRRPGARDAPGHRPGAPGDRALCGDATVAENIFMPEINAGEAGVDELRRASTSAPPRCCARLGQDIDPAALVTDLSISSQQLVEIAKALTLNCKVLILDEPTAALTDNESAALFRVLHDLKAQGIGIIYISHRMAEIFAHGDRVTVLRDGRNVHSGRSPALERRRAGAPHGRARPGQLLPAEAEAQRPE